MSEETKPEELVEYNGRQVYPEVVAYLNSHKEETRNRQRAEHAARYEYDSAVRNLRWEAEDAGELLSRYGSSDFSRRYVELDNDLHRKSEEIGRSTGQAGEALRNSPHKEVAFIAQHCLFASQGDEVEDHARTILSILPATTDEIWIKAKDDAGMCGVFDRFYQQAEGAGVFQKEGEDPFPGMRELVAFRNHISREYGRSCAAQAMGKVHPALKAIRADYDKRLEAAKAEWQRQDEAYAEHVHRIRSEAARRGAETRRRNAERQAVAAEQRIAEAELANADAEARNVLAGAAAEALSRRGFAAEALLPDEDTGSRRDLFAEIEIR